MSICVDSFDIYIYANVVRKSFDDGLVLRLPDMVQQKFAGHPNLKDLMARINDDTEIVQAVKSFHGGATRPSSSATPATETRTLANPEWNGDGPPNVRSKLALTAVTTSAFESSTTWLGL